MIYYLYQVKLTSGKRYKTGQKLKFRLSARPDSLCSLSVVDKSLNILAGQTDYAELIRKQVYVLVIHVSVCSYIYIA